MTTLCRDAVRVKLLNAVSAYDRRQARSKYYNPYALPQYAAAVTRVIRWQDMGYPLRQCIGNAFNGRLLDACLKAVGEPTSTRDEQRIGGFARLPELD